MAQNLIKAGCNMKRKVLFLSIFLISLGAGLSVGVSAQPTSPQDSTEKDIDQVYKKNKETLLDAAVDGAELPSIKIEGKKNQKPEALKNKADEELQDEQNEKALDDAITNEAETPSIKEEKK